MGYSNNYFHLGLNKSAGNCVNEACNDFLMWADGSRFNYSALQDMHYNHALGLTFGNHHYFHMRVDMQYIYAQQSPGNHAGTVSDTHTQ